MRVLICEDSSTYAAVLSHALREEGEVDVAAVCRSAEEAIAVLPKVRPDVVTMDIELPGMSGVEAIEQIMNAHPVPILVLSSHSDQGSKVAAEVLAAGALDAIGKGELDLADPRGAVAGALRSRLKVLAGTRVIRHPRGHLNTGRRSATARARKASVIGICASTGGPQALGTVLGRLPESFPIPVLVVQHMSEGFTEGLVQWLDGAVVPTVRLASGSANLAPGVWIAPEGAHLMLCSEARLTIDRSGPPGLHRPSGDVLFESLAEHAGAQAAAVVLSGMGRDGAAGLESVRGSGGLTIAQDEETSAIFGMPKAAAEAGAELVLAPTAIGDVLSELVPAGIGR
jgi:two-component system chemotaxis response regulator CheB